MRRIINDNLSRLHAAPDNSDEFHERVRAHCDFIKTSVQLHQELVDDLLRRHGWPRTV